MNCAEFRYQLLVEPGCQDAAFTKHLDSCSGCRQEAKQVREFEEKLRRALEPASEAQDPARAPPPQRPVQGRRHRTTGPRHLTVAAALLISIGVSGWLGLQWQQFTGSADGLPALVLQHIEGERRHLRKRGDVSLAEIERALSEFGAELANRPGRVDFLGRCMIGTHPGVHMVLRGEFGPVNVLVLPSEPVDHSQPLSSTRFTGIIVPAGPGSMAVVGGIREPMDRVLNRVARSIVWAAHRQSI